MYMSSCPREELVGKYVYRCNSPRTIGRIYQLKGKPEYGFEQVVVYWANGNHTTESVHLLINFESHMQRLDRTVKNHKARLKKAKEALGEFQRTL